MRRKELKEKFQRDMVIRVDILRNISIDYNYAKYLYQDSISMNLNQHWSRVRHNFYKILFIDIAKLYSNPKSGNQKFNFLKLLTRLEKGDYKKFGMRIERITHFKSELDSHKIFFEVVREYRDTLFAHTEIQAGIGPTDIFFSKLEEIINLGFNICNEISKAILNKEIVNIINLIDLSDLKTD